jgi:hypothetical protein
MAWRRSLPDPSTAGIDHSSGVVGAPFINSSSFTVVAQLRIVIDL